MQRFAAGADASHPAARRRVGGLLLRRERKLTHLTDFGRLISRICQAAGRCRDGQDRLRSAFSACSRREIRLGIMCTVGPARFMSFLANFHAANPGCEITLVEGVPARLSELYYRGNSTSR